MRHGWLSFLLAVVLIGALGGAADGQDIQWSVSVGFDETYRSGAWTPVFVDIANQGRSRARQIVVPLEYQWTVPRAVPRGVHYVVPVELPRNSRKRYVLYAPSEKLDEVLLDLPGQALRSKVPPARAADEQDTLVVVIGGEPGLLSFLNGTPAAAPRRTTPEHPPGHWGGGSTSLSREEPEIVVGRAGWDGLPNSWLGWDGVDAVVLGDAGFAAASPEAVAGLLQWVQLGGVLVAPGGAVAPEIATSPIRDMLPIRFAGTTPLPSLKELARWAEYPIGEQQVLAATGRLAEGAAVLCGSEERPLIASRKVGAGRVVMTALDFGAAPVKYWDGQTAMWPRILAAAPGERPLAEQVQPSAFPYSDITLADAASYTPSARVPPMWLLLGFLAAYIIVLVPVNYHLLRRFDRRELAWVTTPAIIVVFTLGAYGAGLHLRGADLVLNRVGIVEASSGEPVARGRGYVGFFSPSRTTFEFLLQGTAAGAGR